MEGVWRAYKIFNFIKLIGILISGISVLVMMFFIVYDVAVRTLFTSSIRGGFEIIQNYMMPLVVFPGLAYVYASGILPKMDLILDKFSEKIQKVMIFLMILVELFVLVSIVHFSWEYAMSGVERKTAFPAGGTLYTLYPIFFLIPIAFVLIIFENIFILIRNIMVKEPSLLMNKVKGKPEELL